MRAFFLLALVVCAFCIPAVTGETDTAAAIGHDAHHTMVMETTPVPAYNATTGTNTNGTADTGLWQSMVEEAHSGHSGGYTAHSDDDLCKIFFIVLGITNESAFLESAEIRYGHPPNPGYQNGNFTVTLRAHNKTPLISYGVWDPRLQIEQFGFHNELKRHEATEDPAREAGTEGNDIDLPLIIPFHKEIGILELTDTGTNKKLASVSLSPAVEAFRTRFPRDPDMIVHEPAPDSLPFLLVSVPLTAALLGLLMILIRRSR